MKKFLYTIILSFPLMSTAEQPPAMPNQQDIQNMMQLMNKVQECMSKVDKTELKKIEQLSDKFENEVHQLCTIGKRDEAQERALAFGESMLKKPIIKQVNKCSKMMEGMTFPGNTAKIDTDYKNTHVCDAVAKNAQ